jgi:cytochrome c oxidase cbb3-type subunit 3
MGGRRMSKCVACVAFGAILVAVSLGATAQMARWKIDKAAAERGRQTFISTCAFCHGSDARGSERAPDLVLSEMVNKDEQGEQIADVLAKGRPDRGMPPFPALVPQAGDIANFLHDRISLVMNRFSYKIDVGAGGDARAGEAFFNDAGGCKDCHSPTGDLAHVGTKYKPDILQGMIAFPGPATLYYVGVNMRPVDKPPVTVTVILPSGAKLSGAAVFVGEYDISLHTADGVYHSIARTKDMKVEVNDPLDGHRKLLQLLTDAELHNLSAYLMELK